MHTTRTVSKNYHAIYAKYNSDYSGSIKIEWPNKEGEWDTATIPGEVFMALAEEFLHQKIRNKVEAALEKMWDE